MTNINQLKSLINEAVNQTYDAELLDLIFTLLIDEGR